MPRTAGPRAAALNPAITTRRRDMLRAAQWRVCCEDAAALLRVASLCKARGYGQYACND